MKPDKLVEKPVEERIGHVSERELIRRHVERTVAFQRQMIKEQEDRCRKQMADVKALLKAVNWPR